MQEIQEVNNQQFQTLAENFLFLLGKQVVN